MRTRSQKLNWAFIVVMAALCLSAVDCSRSKQLSKDDIRIALGDLRTFAASARFLAEQHQNNSVTNIFFTRQSDILLEKVRSLASELDTPGDGEEDVRQAASRLALSLMERLTKMRAGEARADDPGELTQIAAQAKTLEDGLKERQP